MRVTEFWERMEQHFGAGYARSWAHDTVLAELGSRTPEQALAQGWETVEIWRAVWRHEQLPASER